MTELLAPPNTAAPPPPAETAAPTGPKDFTRKRKRLVFTIDDDTFEAAPALPADLLVEFVNLYNGTGDTEGVPAQLDLLKKALGLALLPESWQRLSPRFKDRANPVDDDQIADIVLWLLEEYGMRPTQPSQPSSDGPASPESGTSSTENTQPEESTSQPSQPAAS